MELRPDGRKYSRITRRSVAIISHVPADRGFTIYELADHVHDLELPEFYVKRFERQMSTLRVRDYVDYLADLKVIEQQEGKYVRTFARRSSDGEWAQALSNLALAHLAGTLNRTADMTPDLLEQQINKLFRENRVPTVRAVLDELGIQGGRAQEAFKWSLYVYADGERCPFEVRRYPTISPRAPEEGE
jgi:hypothetical protein